MSDEVRDGSHDFDFEFGEWTVELSRLVEPLTGLDSWGEYKGTSVVRRVWGGGANLGELDVEGPAGHIQGPSLRLYRPDSGQWSIFWASSRDGALGEPMVGGFRDGVGEFHNQELLDGEAHRRSPPCHRRDTQHVPAGTGILRRRWQLLGGELDHTIQLGPRPALRTQARAEETWIVRWPRDRGHHIPTYRATEGAG